MTAFAMAQEERNEQLNDEQLGVRKAKARNKVRSLIFGAHKYVDLIESITDWNDQVDLTQPARNIHAKIDDIEERGRITRFEFREIRDSLVIIWAMFPDGSSFPKSVTRHNMQKLDWYTNILIELSHAIKGKKKRYTYFDIARAHEDMGKVYDDPVDEINKAIANVRRQKYEASQAVAPVLEYYEDEDELPPIPSWKQTNPDKRPLEYQNFSSKRRRLTASTDSSPTTALFASQTTDFSDSQAGSLLPTTPAKESVEAQTSTTSNPATPRGICDIAQPTRSTLRDDYEQKYRHAKNQLKKFHARNIQLVQDKKDLEKTVQQKTVAYDNISNIINEQAVTIRKLRAELAACEGALESQDDFNKKATETIEFANDSAKDVRKLMSGRDDKVTHQPDELTGGDGDKAQVEDEASTGLQKETEEEARSLRKLSTPIPELE